MELKKNGEVSVKGKNGLEVPSPSRDRRISHVGTGRGQSSGPTSSIIKSTMGTRLSSNASVSTRMSMLSWLWSSDKSAMSGGGSYRKGITSTRKVDLNYDDSDLEVIQSSEQSIADAAIQTRRSYGFRQEISRLRLVLFILLALILGLAITFTVVSVQKSNQPSMASTSPNSAETYTPPKPKDELNIWCDSALLLSFKNSSEDYQACYDACVEGMCCFGGMFDTFPAMQDNTAHHDCYSQSNKDVCQLYKPCENLIDARNQYFFNSNYSVVPSPPADFQYACSLESISESVDSQEQCEVMCSQAACCYPKHPSTCSITEAIACSLYSLCWNLDFVVASIDEADALQIQNRSGNA